MKRTWGPEYPQDLWSRGTESTSGGGRVYPELNFTLPPMLVQTDTMERVRAQYPQISTGAIQRAVELEAPGLVVEFETLPPMTENPVGALS